MAEESGASPTTGTDRQDRRWVCVGTIGGPRGVKGAFFVKPFVEDRAQFRRFDRFHLGPGGEAILLTVERENSKGFIMRTPGIDTPESARALTGYKLYVPREALPEITEEDSFYHVDLVGLEARDLDGERLGVVAAVHNFGAGDLIELALDRPLAGFGDVVLLPFERALFPEVAVRKGWLRVDLPAWVARHLPEGEPKAPPSSRKRRRSPRARTKARKP